MEHVIDLVCVDMKYLSAGENHAAAVDAYGNAWAWGKNDNGQCGVQGAASIVSPPQVVSLQVHIPQTKSRPERDYLTMK